MNMLVDGEWRTDARETTNDDGEFERGVTQFRDRVEADTDATFPAETGRYHLYVSRACPWAHRVMTARKLLGLEDVISMDVVDPYRDEDGWQFTPEKHGCTADSVNDAEYLREVYVAADPATTGRVTVPVLWDRERETIVNNESREILRMLTTAFCEYHTRDIDLSPSSLRGEIDDVIDAIYEPVNNGVYRAGFATAQRAYDRAIDDLFDALEHWDGVLADQRYLVGDQVTEADICLFTTLVRFDHVYHTHFMCNVKQIVDFDNLWPYLRDLVQLDGVADTIDLEHITEHYYTTHPSVTPSRIVARGPDLDFFEPHDRERLTPTTAD